MEVRPPTEGGETSLGMVFQEHGLFPWLTIEDNIGFILKNNPRIAREEIADTVQHYLERVGLADFRGYYPGQLSGGMRQRVSLARSFANRPDLLLMDEPFVFLDFQTRVMLQDLLLEIWEASPTTVLFVTHDIEEAVLLADRILVMSAHPGTLKAEMTVDIPRPRRYFELRRDPIFHQQVDALAGLIRPELAVADAPAGRGAA